MAMTGGVSGSRSSGACLLAVDTSVTDRYQTDGPQVSSGTHSNAALLYLTHAFKSTYRPRLPACVKTEGNAMNNAPKWKTRLVQGEFPDRDFDIEFWQEQGDEAIFRGAWAMGEDTEAFQQCRKATLQRTGTRRK